MSKDSTDPKLFNLIKTIDTSLENYSISELQERRSNIKTLTSFVDKNENSPILDNNPIKTYFKNQFADKSKETGNETQTRKIDNK